MEVEYADGSLLAFWYDTWLILIGYAATIVVTVGLIVRGLWRGPGVLVLLPRHALGSTQERRIYLDSQGLRPKTRRAASASTAR